MATDFEREGNWSGTPPCSSPPPISTGACSSAARSGL